MPQNEGDAVSPMPFVRLMIVGSLLCASAASAQAPSTPTAPAVITTAARLRTLGDSLTPGASKTGQLGRGPNLTYALTHRDTSGGLEVHVAWTDVLVIQSGSAK